MPDSIFLDTNILIYLYSEDELDKREAAMACANLSNIWISTQVLSEMINVLRRKFAVSHDTLLELISELESRFSITTVTTSTVRQALLINQRYGYAWFDSLILTSALELGCSALYSEDLHHGQTIGDHLTIVNPFLR